MRLPWSHQAEKFREVRGGSPSKKLREFRQCLTDGQSCPGPHLKGDSQPLSPSLTQACFNLVKESLFLTSFLFSHHTHTLNTVVLHTHTHTIKTPHCTQSHQTSNQAHAYPLLTSTPQSLASQTPQHTAHHSHDSTACTPPLTHAPLMSTPLRAQFHTHILQYSTHIIFTHTRSYKNYMLTHNPTTYIHNPPYSPHDSHIHMNTDHYTHIPHTPMHTHPEHCIRSPLFTHTPPHKLQCAHIYTPSTYLHTHYICNSLYIYPPLHTHFRSTIHTPHIHTHTPHSTHAHKPTSSHTQALPLLILKR